MSSRKRTVALEIKLKNQQLKMVQYVPSIFRGVSARGVSLPAPFQQMTAHGPNLERWSIYTATFLKKFGNLHGKQSTGTAVLQESEEEKNHGRCIWAKRPIAGRIREFCAWPRASWAERCST